MNRIVTGATSAAAALLLLGAAAQDRGGRPGAAICDPAIQQSPADFTWTAYPGRSFFQPIGPTTNLSGFSVDFQASQYSAASFRVVAWDSAQLAPDLSTVAFRSRSYRVSMSSSSAFQQSYDPPVVQQVVPGVAEKPPTALAVEYRIDFNGYGWVQQTVYFNGYGDPAVPLAYTFDGVSTMPIPGPHGLLGHAICPASDDLWVCQSVMRCDSIISSNRHAVAQRFRVPVATKLWWIELAFGNHTDAVLPGLIRVLDAEGTLSPPAMPDAALFASLYGAPESKAWGTHASVDESVLLQPNHDYWLFVTLDTYQQVYTKRIAGPQSPDFQSGIGSFWIQPEFGGSWLPYPRNALAFRLLGEPLGLTAVGDVPVRAGALRLTAAPNPASSRSVIQWSGAHGAIEVEVYDPAGRRVTGWTSAGEPEGRWLWRPVREPLPSGMYFVLARDAAGQSASTRLAIVR